MVNITLQRAFIYLVIGSILPLLSYADGIDPTRPPAYGSSSGIYDLNEITIGPHGKSAVIGGHEFHEGDDFQGITVLEIKPNTVKIKGARGEDVTLELFPVFKQKI